MKKISLFSKVIILLIISFKNIKNDAKEYRAFSILKSDKDLLKPMIKLNAEFELIKMKNGMEGLLIHDPFSTISHIHFEVENGCYSDTIPSISHLAEHMIYGGSKNYKNYYPILRTIGGINLYSGGAITGQTNQEYFFTIPYNFKFEEGLKVFIDGFIHPLFSEEIIKKEIQALNSEFYFYINEQYHLLDAIIRQLCSNKTSFYGFTSGNNNTLNPEESKLLSKKLKSYHNIVNKPENLFFILYSNLTIKDLENYSEQYLNYKMHLFPENETDNLEKEKILNNLENYKNNEIFDENLYGHGIYYNSNFKKNYMSIFFYVGEIDFKDLQFDIFEYYSYLFKSKSLMKLLKEKNYISLIHEFEIEGSVLIKNNNVFSINIELTENGVNNINEVLLIIYKYIDIMKKEGINKKYFYDFIKYKRNQNNKDFQKEMFNILTTFSNIIESYRTFGIDQIFNYGTPTFKNYNSNKLKTLLNQIKVEKSFYIINTISKVSELKTFLEFESLKKLKYYNKDYLIGKFPYTLINEIKDNNFKIDNLSIRNINPYFSEKYEKEIPCYKKEINNCKEINEFDYELEDKYKGKLLEDNKYYITYYQIDKSSESFIVNIYLELKFVENENITNEAIDLIKFYINDISSEINEIPTISIVKFDKSFIAFKIQSFSDNIEKIFYEFIKYLKQEPQEYEFNYSKISIKSQNIEKDNLLFRDYVFDIGNQFMSGGIRTKPNINDIIEKINNINFNNFKNIYNNIFKKIILINFKIAGNIDKNLVLRLNNYLKENIKIFINNNLITCDDDLKQKSINEDKSNSNKESSNDYLKQEFSYIIDYYQKSTMINEYDGGIFIIYKFEDKFKDYMNVLKGCLENIGKIYLRFKYSHSYHPKIYVENNFFMIFEQGRYKEPAEMEDDINEVLLGMIKGNVKCENYKDIIKSYKIKPLDIIEKNPLNLFNSFISEKNENENINYLKKKFPKSFRKFMKKISTVFTEPRRYTILIIRNEISDNLFNEIMKKRKKTAKYILNENINIIHTNNIEFLKHRKY